MNTEQAFRNGLESRYLASLQNAPQYQFSRLPTPAHSNVITSDEISDGSPPDAFDQYQNFDSYNYFNSNGIPSPPRTTAISNPKDVMDMSLDALGAEARQGSNSDDEDMTPAQARRKAQNRAAQRAFRERKEQRVKALEAEVAALKQTSSSVFAENERLKLNLQKFATENEILKATSQQGRISQATPAPADAGPMRYYPKDFYSKVLQDHEDKTVSHRVVTNDKTGDRLLAAGATWDFIIRHPLFQRGLVDVSSVSELLKGHAECDGQGPVFKESVIVEAIERSAVNSGDDLM